MSKKISIESHSKNFEKVKRYYDNGFWKKFMVYNIVAKGWITAAEYKEITGEEYATEG